MSLIGKLEELKRAERGKMERKAEAIAAHGINRFSNPSITIPTHQETMRKSELLSVTRGSYTTRSSMVTDFWSSALGHSMSFVNPLTHNPLTANDGPRAAQHCDKTCSTSMIQNTSPTSRFSSLMSRMFVLLR